MIKLRWFFSVLTVVVLCSHNLMAQWVTQHSPLPNDVWVYAFHPVDANIVWGFGMTFSRPYQGVIRTVDGGKNWSLKQVTPASGLWLGGVFARDSSTAWVLVTDLSCTPPGSLLKTTNGGNTWVKQSTAFLNSAACPLFVYFFDANQGVCAGDQATGNFEVFTTTNGGDNWTLVTSDSIPQNLSGEISAINNHVVVGDTLWFGTSQGRIYRTHNRGRSWAAFDIGLGNTFVSCAFQDANNGLATRVLANQSNQIARTVDGGKTWTVLPSPSPIPGSIRHIPGTKNSYMLCYDYDPPEARGSAYTLDGGETWTKIDNLSHQIPAFVSPTIGWVGSGFRGGIATNSIYKWSGPPLPVNEMLGDLPIHFAMSQSYPNPFNPSTTIRYSLAKAEQVSLKIFNLAGQEIATLFEGKQSAGEHHVQWQAQGAPSGIYFYRLQMGEKVETRKMILMR